MKILILSFYYQPDLSAGSFRCAALVEQLSKAEGVELDVITTLPNRYASFSSEAKEQETIENVNIHRVKLPSHQSGMLDQSKAFISYYKAVMKLVANNQYDMVYATSSRLFTAFLGARIAKKKSIPLYLDVRDIFVDTISDVLPSFITFFAKPVLNYIENYSFGAARRINLVSRGFQSYFQKRYPQVEYRWFTNGIDKEFLDTVKPLDNKVLTEGENVTILYAGNIGEGQGLESIVPCLAKKLGSNVMIKIIGDGGKKQNLIDALALEKINNVHMLPPVSRDQLILEYRKADVLFLHLNDYPAFEKVLPSKIFEYAAMGKPILAGVGGYAGGFLREEVMNSAVFSPGKCDEGINAYSLLSMKVIERKEFNSKYSRTRIMKLMADDILSFAKDNVSDL